MSPALGESFPAKFLEDFVEDNIKVGSVIKGHVKDTKPPKEKRFIIVGINKEQSTIATIYINSEINFNVFQTNELKKLQIEFDLKNRNYLDRSSFVDCSDLKIKTIEEIKNILINNIQNHLGFLDEIDLKLILSTIKNANTIPISQKKKFGLFY